MIEFRSILQNEAEIRLWAFAATLFVMVTLEQRFPFRARVRPAIAHYGVNLSLIVIGSTLVRLLLPLAAVAWAGFMAERGIGLYHHAGIADRLPWYAWTIATAVTLDFAIYLQHRVFHKVDWLWRFHRIHHSDLDFDATTGVRFHPIEILFSMAIKFGVIAALGADPLGVLVFEVLLNASSLFNHANFSLPSSIEPWVRRVIVTPDMHRVHHSVEHQGMNSNFGFCLSLWDRVFGTYRAKPSARDARTMKIGLNGMSESNQSLVQLLLQPFHSADQHDSRRR